MGLTLADILKYPKLLEYNLEKRIIPRYSVMEALKSMRVQEFKRQKSLPRIIDLTEKCFLEAYVHNQVESSFLLDIYHGGKDGKVIIDKETLNECGSIKDTQGSSGLST